MHAGQGPQRIKDGGSLKNEMLRAQGLAHSLLGKDSTGKRKETDDRSHPMRQEGTLTFQGEEVEGMKQQGQGEVTV